MEQKEEEPAENDGWGAWKDPPKEEVGKQEEELEMKGDQAE